MAIILGIDPGSRVAGFGLVHLKAGGIHYLEHGVLDVTKERSFLSRLELLGRLTEELLNRTRPDVLAIEEVFLGKNVDSAFKLGHARGLIIYQALLAGLEIKEYSTRLVKKSVTGSGSSEKEQVRWFLEKFFKRSLNGVPLDATDALALAYHGAVAIELEKKLRGPGFQKSP